MRKGCYPVCFEEIERVDIWDNYEAPISNGCLVCIYSKGVVDILMREERRQKIRKEKRNQAGIYRIRNYSYFRGKATKSASAVISSTIQLSNMFEEYISERYSL